MYEGVAGWESFEPWLSRIENMSEDVIWAAAGEIPADWYGGEWEALESLVTRLIARRALVRDDFRISNVEPETVSPVEGRCLRLREIESLTAKVALRRARKGREENLETQRARRMARRGKR